MGGVVVGRKHLIDEIYTFCRSTGPALSPFNAWVLSKSLEALSLRMERHATNALAIAKHLEGTTYLEQVRYPFPPAGPQFDLRQAPHRPESHSMSSAGDQVPRV